MITKTINKKQKSDWKFYLIMIPEFFVYATISSWLLNLIQVYLYAEFDILPYLFVVILVDLITGLGKAVKNKEAVLSKGLRRTLDKVIQYGAFLIVTHVLAKPEISYPFSKHIAWLPKSAAIYLILVEMKSILENIYGANKQIPTKGVLAIILTILKVNRLNKDNTNADNK